MIQGGLRLTAWDDAKHDDLDSGTPGVRGGLRTFGRDLSEIRNESVDIFQLPQIYWNHLTNNDQVPSGGNGMGAHGKNTGSPPWTGPEGMLHESTAAAWDFSAAASGASSSAAGASMGGIMPGNVARGYDVPLHGQTVGGVNAGLPDNGAMDEGALGSDQDPAAIYSALMSYLVQAARGQGQ